MRCDNCGTWNEDGAEHCVHCGAPLTHVDEAREGHGTGRVDEILAELEAEFAREAELAAELAKATAAAEAEALAKAKALQETLTGADAADEAVVEAAPESAEEAVDEAAEDVAPEDVEGEVAEAQAPDAEADAVDEEAPELLEEGEEPAVEEEEPLVAEEETDDADQAEEPEAEPESETEPKDADVTEVEDGPEAADVVEDDSSENEVTSEGEDASDVEAKNDDAPGASVDSLEEPEEPEEPEVSDFIAIPEVESRRGRFCLRCGSPIDEGDDRCPACGAPLDSMVETIAGNGVVSEFSESVRVNRAEVEERREENRKLVALIGIASVALILVAIIVSCVDSCSTRHDIAPVAQAESSEAQESAEGEEGATEGEGEAEAEAETEAEAEAAPVIAPVASEPGTSLAGNLKNGGYVTISDGWIYYVIPDGSDGWHASSIGRMREDGNMRSVIYSAPDSDSIITDLNVVGDRLYFNEDDGWTSRVITIPASGGDRESVSTNNSGSLCQAFNGIVYLRDYDGMWQFDPNIWSCDYIDVSIWDYDQWFAWTAPAGASGTALYCYQRGGTTIYATQPAEGGAPFWEVLRVADGQGILEAIPTNECVWLLVDTNYDGYGDEVMKGAYDGSGVTSYGLTSAPASYMNASDAGLFVVVVDGDSRRVERMDGDGAAPVVYYTSAYGEEVSYPNVYGEYLYFGVASDSLNIMRVPLNNPDWEAKPLS